MIKLWIGRMSFAALVVVNVVIAASDLSAQFQPPGSQLPTWNRVDDRDIAEVECLPDLNEHMPSVHSPDNVR